jgi:outer membrane protein OmpA-like peptidoglycan-associated protein
VALGCLALPAPPAASAQSTTGAGQLGEVQGSKDHPLIRRYEGSIIIGYEFQKFGDADVLLAPVKGGGPGMANQLTPTKSRRVEGQVIRILYLVPEGRSPLEVARNYEQELKSQGFETVFRCARAECGGDDGWLAEYYLYSLDRRIKQTPATGGSAPQGQISEYALSSAKNQQFLTARRTTPEGEAYASVYVATNDFNVFKETYGHAVVLLDVVETAPMETRMITVDAASIAEDVATTGRVALYGIYFDTDKAELKPESGPTLEEIAKYLTQDPKVNLYVVGHTDNVGDYQHNLTLSDRRAGAVVRELTTRHGVSAARLKPAGTGPLAPVAPNDTEEGRAKNRRVELVRR